MGKCGIKECRNYAIANRKDAIDLFVKLLMSSEGL